MFERGIPTVLTAAALAHLRDAGVQPRSIVAWLGHNSWDMLATLGACERLGAVLLPLNWRLAPAELAHILQHAGASLLLGTPELESLATEVLAAAPGGLAAPGAAQGVQEGDLLLVYTSGTTGAPKGALLTRQGIAANTLAAVAAQGLNAQSRVLAVLPLFHAGGLCIQTLPALAVGAQLLLHPRFDADAWFDAVAQWRPSTTLLVPAVMTALIEHPRWAGADLSSLAFVNSGSQIVPLALIKAFHARGVPVAQVYGATETGPVSLVLKPEEALAHAGMAGRPALGVSLRLGSDGEVQLKAPQLMRGYHRSSEASFDAQGWFHTGDLALEHPGGWFEIVGRRGDLIISGGENIHPAEIESLIAGLPGVVGCAVVGLPHLRWGEVPVLAVVRALSPEGDALSAHGFEQALEGRLARFKWPQRVEFLQALPTTALGKVARAPLRVQLLALGSPDAPPSPTAS